MYDKYKNEILSWVEEAENRAVSDIDFLDIVGKLMYKNYFKMRIQLLKEMIDRNEEYIPTESGTTETDTIFTSEEVKKMLVFVRELYDLHCLNNNLNKAKELKKYHNDLIDNLECGGCWNDNAPNKI